MAYRSGIAGAGTAAERDKWIRRGVGILDRLAGTSFENFKRIQPPPHRSLNVGATGMAYTFWKAACFLNQPRWLHLARQWIDKVIDTPEDEATVEAPEDENNLKLQVKDSFYHGNRGVYFVQALVGYAQNDSRSMNRAVREYSQPEYRRLRLQELVQGMAGRLVGYALLYRETGYPQLVDMGNRVAGELLDTACAGENSLPWENNHHLGLAHGRAGNYFALLLWSLITGYQPPPWMLYNLRKYAESGVERKGGISWPVDERAPRYYMDSWCNGAPGLLHLWTSAYRVYGDPIFLNTARKTGDYCTGLSDFEYSHVCCGTAGVSYGLLALSQADPEGEWLAEAVRFARMAYRGKPVPRYRLSLYSGIAGLACLMLDMADPGAASQPAVWG